MAYGWVLADADPAKSSRVMAVLQTPVESVLLTTPVGAVSTHFRKGDGNACHVPWARLLDGHHGTPSDRELQADGRSLGPEPVLMLRQASGRDVKQCPGDPHS